LATFNIKKNSILTAFKNRSPAWGNQKAS